jgi:ribosomal protein L2
MVKFYIFSFNKLFKSFIFGIASKSGRNFFGRICVQHRGGRAKLNALKIDRFRYINNFGMILKIFKDYYHTGFLGLVCYDLGISSIILLSEGVLKGNFIFSGGGVLANNIFSYSKVGSTQLLLRANLFDQISSIEIFPLSGFKLVRSAGCSAKIISKTINILF